MSVRDFCEPPRKYAPCVGHSHLCCSAAPREQRVRPERPKRCASPPLLRIPRHVRLDAVHDVIPAPRGARGEPCMGGALTCTTAATGRTYVRAAPSSPSSMALSTACGPKRTPAAMRASSVAPSTRIPNTLGVLVLLPSSSRPVAAPLPNATRAASKVRGLDASVSIVKARDPPLPLSIAVDLCTTAAPSRAAERGRLLIVTLLAVAAET